jgi:hypothetical protein
MGYQAVSDLDSESPTTYWSSIPEIRSRLTTIAPPLGENRTSANITAEDTEGEATMDTISSESSPVPVPLDLDPAPAPHWQS